MLKKFFKKYLAFALTSMVMASSIFYSPVTVKAAVNKVAQKEFGQPEKLIPPISSAIGLFDGAVGQQDGRNVMYTTVNGTPSVFNVIDLENYKLIDSFVLEGVNQTWVHEVAKDGTAYIGTNGDKPTLWVYSPVKKQVEKLVTLDGESSIWSLITDENNNVYAGTFPGGKVYRYNPTTKDLKDFGRMLGDAAQEYVRSIAYDNGFIYAGTEKKKIIKLNVNTGEKVDIATAPVLSGETAFCYDLDVVGKYLFARYDKSKKVYIYDLENGVWSDTYLQNVNGLHMSKELEGKSYFISDGKLKSVDLNTLTFEDLGIAYGSSFRGVDVVKMKNDPELPGDNIVTMQYGGSVVFFNLQNKKMKMYPPVVAPSAAEIQSLEKGPDGKLYTSGYTSAIGGAYDTVTNTNKSFSLPQAEGMGTLGDKIYMGTYPHAEIYELDTKNATGTGNPKKIFTIGEEQDRPFKVISAEDKVFFGTIPDYGKLGGALTVYNSALTGNESYKVYRNIVQDQSVVGLAYKDGKIYGSTSIAGGLGSTPTAKEAKIFVWDVAKEKKLSEISLNIDGLDNPRMISGLEFGSDGLLWGAADGFIFAINPDTLQVVKSKNIYPTVKGYGIWRPVYLRWSEDGLLYANVAGKLTAIDPNTLDSTYIVDTPLYTIGDDGDLYYAKGSMLQKIVVSDKILAVSGVSLNKEKETINLNETVQLEAAVAPENATNSKVTWKSSDEKVATVDENGLVKGIGVGTATITVSTEDGAFTKSAEITVVEKTVAEEPDKPGAEDNTNNIETESDKETSEQLPKTGELNNSVALISLGILIVASGILLYKKRSLIKH